MSVLVCGMEMPKNCWQCHFFHTSLHRISDDELLEIYTCLRTGERTENVTGYLKNCPLVEIPPHGRLGDLDDLQQKINTLRIKAMADKVDVDPYWHCLDAILQTKTIIPAEEADT